MYFDAVDPPESGYLLAAAYWITGRPNSIVCISISFFSELDLFFRLMTIDFTEQIWCFEISLVDILTPVCASFF